MKTAIGIDLGGTNTRVALVAEDGTILGSMREKTPIDQGPEVTARLMASQVKQLAAQNSQHKILGIGIGSPGPLNRSEKTLFETVNLPGFKNYPLGAKVQEFTGIRTELDNDAKCAAYGEGFFGVARGVKHYILMTFGTGIGGGIIIDGKMLYGKSDGACELGHITLYPDGHPCPCGNRGCYEQYGSATAIERRSAEYFGKPQDPRDIFEMLKEGDRRAETLLKAVSLDIAIATASLINLFEPQMVVLGGGIFTEGGGPMPGWIREMIRDRCFRSSQKDMQLLPSSLTGNSGVLGAASLILKH